MYTCTTLISAIVLSGSHL